MFDSSNKGSANGASVPLPPCVVGESGPLGAPKLRSAPRRQELSLFLLSDLFAAGYMGKSKFVRDKRLIGLAKDRKTVFTGEALDQWDLDVLLHCAMRTAAFPECTGRIHVDPGKLLRDMRLRNYEDNRDRVYSSLFRLHTGALIIVEAGRRGMVRLVERVFLDRSREHCRIEVNRGVVNALHCARYREMTLETRADLKRCGLAKWLHGASTIFRGGFRAELTSLHRLCGASNRSRYIFPGLLAKALALMAECGVVDSWELDGPLLKVLPSSRPGPGEAHGELFQSSLRSR